MFFCVENRENGISEVELKADSFLLCTCSLFLATLFSSILSAFCNHGGAAGVKICKAMWMLLKTTRGNATDHSFH